MTLNKNLLLTRSINKNQSQIWVLWCFTFLPPEMLWISWRALVSRSFMAKLDSFFCPSFYKQCIFDLFTNNTYLIPWWTIRLKMYLIFMFLCHMWIRNWVFQSWLLGVQLFTVYYNIYFNFIYSWWVVIRCSILWVVAGAVVGRKRPQAPSASAPWPSPVLSSCAMSLHMDTTTRASPAITAITSPQKSDAPPYMATTKQSLSSTIFVHRGSGLRTQHNKETREINIHDMARVTHKLFDTLRKLVSGKKRQKHTKKHKNTPPTILHSDKCWENWSLGTTQENAPTIIGCLLVHLSLDEKPPSILYFRKYLLGGHYHYQLPQQIS